VGAVLPVDVPGVYQSQVGFIDERSRLQRVARSFSEHVPPSQAAQLLVDKREKFFQGRVFPLTPSPQESGDVLSRGCRQGVLLTDSIPKGREVGRV
jgi:hypothetical protein